MQWLQGLANHRKRRNANQTSPIKTGKPSCHLQSSWEGISLIGLLQPNFKKEKYAYLHYFQKDQGQIDQMKHQEECERQAFQNFYQGRSRKVWKNINTWKININNNCSEVWWNRKKETNNLPKWRNISNSKIKKKLVQPTPFTFLTVQVKDIRQKGITKSAIMLKSYQCSYCFYI